MKSVHPSRRTGAEIKIRPAVPGDVEMLCAIQDETRLSPWTRSGYEAEMQRRDSMILVAEYGAELVGFIVGRIIASLEAETSSEAEIYNIAVREPSRRQGVASGLLKSFIAECSRSNVSRLWLEVRASNDPAIGFYRSHGFIEEGRRKGFYTAPLEDARVMVLEIARAREIRKDA